jgi:mono/diheme cytochrome c family protein
MSISSRFLVFLAIAACLASAQDAPQVKIKHVPLKHSNPASGREMFVTHCAACHGVDGRGDGPAVPALKSVPPNLTTLTKSHEGKFPSSLVANAIRGDTSPSAHGSQDMPVWGDTFRAVGASSTIVTLRITNLTRYIESIQEK